MTSFGSPRLAHLTIQWSAILLYGLAITGYPVVAFLPEFLDVSSRIITVPYRAIVLSLSLLVLMGSIRENTLVQRIPLLVALMVFCSLYALRIFLDAGVYRVTLGRPWWEYAVYGAGICIIPMLAMMLCNSREIAKRALLSVWGMGVVGALLASLNFDRITAVGRLRATDALNPITLGHLGATLATLSIFLLLQFKWNWKFRIVLMLTTGLGAALLGISGSRSPIVAFILMLCALAWIGMRKQSLLRALLAFGALAAAVPWLLRKIEEWGSSTFQRLESTFETGSEGELRIYMWQVAWDAFRENPWFGSSLDGAFGTYPHNLWIESFMATGLFGGFAFFSVTAVATISALRLIYHRSNQAWIAILLIQAEIYAMFSGAIYSHTFLWCTLGGTLGVYFSSRYPRTRSQRAGYSYLTQSQRGRGTVSDC